MKAIIIGASLTGKTTLIRHLRATSKLPISEMDEELTNANGGQFPEKLKKRRLARKIVGEVLQRNEILFFTNTDYFSKDDLALARKNGFRIVQLVLPLEALKSRNKNRVENEGYSDLSLWLKGMMDYQEDIKQNGLVDISIDMSQSVEAIAKELLGALVK